MKKQFLYILFALAFVTSCKEKLNVSELEQKKNDIAKMLVDEQKALASQINKISDLEQQIKDLDKELRKSGTIKSEEASSSVVSTLQSQSGPFEHYFEIQGAIDADKNIMVTPEMGGKIVSLPVRKGQFIQKGAVIATFDTEIINSNKKQLEEQLATAKYMYDKQKRLFDKGVSTEIALKQAEGQYNTLLKSMDILNTQASKSVLVAPFSGYIENVFPVAGGMAGPSTPVIQLIGMNSLKVVANVSENYLKTLNRSSLVDLDFPAIDFQLKNQKISRIGKSVNPVNRTIMLEVNIPKANKKMIPNLMAIMKVRDYSVPNAVTIPAHVILTNSDRENFVYVVNADNTVSERIVKVGKTYNDQVEILEGLKANETVVDRGARKVVEGDKVEIRK